MTKLVTVQTEGRRRVPTREMGRMSGEKGTKPDSSGTDISLCKKEGRVKKEGRELWEFLLNRGGVTSKRVTPSL